MTNLRLPIDGVFCVMEIWKYVPGYEGLYQASSLGRVKNLQRKKEKIFKASPNKGGYITISLKKNNYTKYFYTHQIIAITFLDFKICGHKLEVDHINNIKSDNRVENLQILTHRDNTFKNPNRFMKAKFLNKQLKFEF